MKQIKVSSAAVNWLILVLSGSRFPIFLAIGKYLYCEIPPADRATIPQ